MFSFVLFSLFILFSYCFFPVHLLSQYPIIVIVSYDAFRYDYISKGVNPVLEKLRDEGTFAEYMDNVFVTKTFPNHHSIATGVYPEFHGVLGNSFYDNYYEKQLNYSYELWHYSDEILPIWIANEKKGEGRHSGVMMWPGNEYEYSGIKPTYQKAWSYNVTWQERVDIVIQWILNPEKPANLVLLYIEEPDYHGHSFGADSPKLAEELKLLDSITHYFLEKLRVNNLTSHINVFFLADHGMLSVTKKDVIDLREIVSSDLYDKYEGSPVLHIYPKVGKANEVYNALKEAASRGVPFNVYKKAEIPERWHFKNNRRAPPILVVADPPHVFQDFYPYIEDLQKRWNFIADDTTPFGIHGYDNEVQSMKPYFIAIGPNIKKKFKIQPFKTVDLFSLWAHMSNFSEYAIKTNGSLEIVSQMLKTSTYLNTGLIVFGVLMLVVIAVVVVYFSYKKWSSQRKLYFRGTRTATQHFCSTRFQYRKTFTPKKSSVLATPTATPTQRTPTRCFLIEHTKKSLLKPCVLKRLNEESAQSRQRLLDSEEES